MQSVLIIFTMKLTLALPLLVSLAQAVQISVSGSNANVSSVYQYGIMFEGKYFPNALRESC